MASRPSIAPAQGRKDCLERTFGEASEMDEVLAGGDADDASAVKPAKEAGKSGKKKESWLDKWKKKKAEKPDEED